jgi:OHCU decarboxylase
VNFGSLKLEELNALSKQYAESELLRCCGSREWAQRMAAVRPYQDIASMNNEAERIWWSLGKTDWLEAFAAHPKIGESRPNTAWAAQEQAEVHSAAAATVAALALANEQYLAKFGYVFIVCATGKSGKELLSILESRLTNDPEDELRIAASEQSKITGIRLDKLVRS